MLATIDPYDVKRSVPITSLDNLDADPLCQLAREVATDVQALHRLAAEQPRYAALYDQCQRSSSSIFLNTYQGYSKLRGFLLNDLLCARAEAAETYAALCLFPRDVSQPIKLKVREVLKLLDERIMALPVRDSR